MHSKKGLPFIKAVLPSLGLNFWVGAVGIPFGLIAGLLAAIQPRLLMAAMVAPFILAYFFADFERAVLGLLIIRSSLDLFSGQQIPAAFAIGLDALTIIYVIFRLLTKQPVQTDRFWWFLAGWVMLQGLWVVLLLLGGLGLGGGYLSSSIREWIRLFTWMMIYLLVMQLRDRISPQALLSRLYLGLIAPLTVALMQICLPASILPGFLAPADERIAGTFGHPNGFATFLLLFIGLTWWQLNRSQRRWPWVVLLILLALCLVSTKALFSLMLLGILVLVLIAPRLNLFTLIGGILLFVIVISLFASTEFGRERLNSIANTPLLNPNIDISRAILMSNSDMNSFNWRLSQWYRMLSAWQRYPILGYGLGLSIPAGGNNFLPHNDYVRALVEGGIVGLITFIAFLSAPIVRLIWLIRSPGVGGDQHHFCSSLLAFFVALPIGMITENIWSHTTLFFYWWAVFAIAGWNWHQTASPSPIHNSDKARPSRYEY